MLKKFSVKESEKEQGVANFPIILVCTIWLIHPVLIHYIETGSTYLYISKKFILFFDEILGFISDKINVSNHKVTGNNVGKHSVFDLIVLLSTVVKLRSAGAHKNR